MHRFSDFASEESRLDGDKVKIDDILTQEITIKAFTLSDSRFSKNKSGKYLTVQFCGADGIDKVFFGGSDVLSDQLEKYKSELPFVATIKKINKYYTLN